ncbi:hypothetical protein P3T76_002693 [Phytophthora citrophthora]|uniref:Uncharacterized protein n=1 Tax=Phytophthora citrophthora TaxID=4793 RepID=A0AAD9GW46_9STRA|nr:hypothetical protein P3T76_002693 [Phytophthora citrophthora]
MTTSVESVNVVEGVAGQAEVEQRAATDAVEAATGAVEAASTAPGPPEDGAVQPGTSELLVAILTATDMAEAVAAAVGAAIAET